MDSSLPSCSFSTHLFPSASLPLPLYVPSLYDFMLHLLSFLSTFPFSFSSKLHTPFSSPPPFLSWLLPSLSSPFPYFLFSFHFFSTAPSFLTPHSACASLLPSLLDFLVFFLHSSLFPVLTSFIPFPFCIFLHLSSMFPFFFLVPPLLLSSPSFPLPHFPPLGSLPFSLRSFSSLPQFFPVRGRDQSGTYEACSGINQRCSEAS